MEQLYDSDVILAGRTQSLKSIVRNHLIVPHQSDTPDVERRYSAVFFGPPGTAKTSLAEMIAEALGWSFVYLQTSDFLSSGFELISNRSRYVFDRLCMLENAVILFDEVEEFVRDRSDPKLSAESRMLTNVMLPLIQELRRRQNVIFVVATNHLDAFDSAVTRAGGRFDVLLLMSPPNLMEKKAHMQKRLGPSFEAVERLLRGCRWRI